MGFPTRTLSGVCEISTASFLISSMPKAHEGENGAIDVVVQFRYQGKSYSVDSLKAEMYLFFKSKNIMTDSVELAVNGDTATGGIPAELISRAGCPLLVITLTDPETGQQIVACHVSVHVENILGSTVITTRPPTPSETVYVGRAPYIGENGNWYTFDNIDFAFVDSGVTASGPRGDDGVDGQTPYIGENGNWWIGNTDTGTKAQGPAGTGSGTVTSVKIGEETYKPDETGVVTLPETEGGAVQTVNGVSPDDTGNVNLVVDTIETNATRIAVTDLPNYPGVDIVGTDSDGTQTYQGSVRLNMQNTKGGYPVMEQVNPAGTATCEIYTTANKPSASDLGISFDSLTVNGVTPDEDGNVQLDAEDVGALSAGDVLSYEEIQASTDLTGKLPSAQALADGVGKIGKVLWSGSFTTGTITVPGLSEYETIAVKAGSVFMFGGKNYGHGGILAYGNKNPLAYAYRFTIDGDNVSAGVNQYDLGCYTADGAQQTVTQIYGIF